MNIKLFPLILLIMAYSVSASTNDCELLAKNYQNEHYGDLILIQPLKDNGAYDFGIYKGHWINKAYNKNMGIYYYDPSSDTYFSSVNAIKIELERVWNQKVSIFNYNKGEVPFGITWHY